MEKEEKKQKKSLKKGLFVVGSVVAAAGLGYVLGNEKTRTVIIKSAGKVATGVKGVFTKKETTTTPEVKSVQHQQQPWTPKKNYNNNTWGEKNYRTEKINN